MNYATSKAVLIAWDMGRGPTFHADGSRFFALYRVYRDGVAIGETCAEAFYDTKVRRGAVYAYQVRAIGEGDAETAVGPSFTVHVPRQRPSDRVPPTAPEKLTTTGWTPSSDSGSGVLAYFVERGNGSQPWAVLWNSGEGGPTSGKRHTWEDPSVPKVPYRLRALDGALNLSKPSNVVTPVAGWTVYTFLDSSRFTLVEGTEVVADVLLVAGGAAGGATNNGVGGGGAAGEVRDLHKVTLQAGVNDGEIVVGAGGTVSHTRDGDGTALDAEDSTFGDLVAKGGGRGGELWLHDDVSPNQWEVAADGGSGGGAIPANDRYPDWQTADPAVVAAPGESTAVPYTVETNIPYGDGSMDSFTAYALENGYAGGTPTGSWVDAEAQAFWVVQHIGGCAGLLGGGAAVNHGGGGGGAHDLPVPFWVDQYSEAQSSNTFHGVHGRPCDIRGWTLYEETGHALMFVDWYGGGGAAGAWLPGGWSWGPVYSKPGYGGGGGLSYENGWGVHGAPWSGGGGCGGGITFGDDNSIAAAGNGGSGIAVVRIRTEDESKVHYPPITGIDPDPDHNEFGQPVCLCDDPHVRIRRLPSYMTHDDCSGDEQCPRTYAEMH